jgi:photosystem II stability/assembly factor-like uncharacterized protein
MYLGFANGQQGGVLKSIDGGTTWQGVGVQDIHVPIQSVEIDTQNPNVVYVATGAILFKSLNGGRSWGIVGVDLSKQNWTGPDLNFVASDPFRSDHLFAGYARLVDGSNLFESTDGGVSWEYVASAVVSAFFNGPSSKPMRADKWRFYGFHPTVPNMRAALVETMGDPPPKLAISKDSGKSWDDVTIIEKGANQFNDRAQISAFAWSQKSPCTIYAGTSRALYASSDCGRQWTKLLPVPVSSIIMPASGDLYVASSVGVLKSRNGGANWHFSSIGLPTTAGVTDSNLMGMGGVTKDAFDAFAQGFGTTGFLLEGVMGSNIYVGGRGGFWTSPDCGITWSWRSIESNLTPGISADILPRYHGPNVRQLLVSRDGAMFVNLVTQGAFGTGEAQILKIQPDGKISNVKAGKMINMMGISPADPQTVYATASEGLGTWTSPDSGTTLMKSEDGGFSWESYNLGQSLRPAVRGFSVTGIKKLAVAFQTSKIVYASLNLYDQRSRQSNVALVATWDGGNTWHDIFQDRFIGVSTTQTLTLLGPVYLTSIAVGSNDGRTVYFSLNNALFKSVDGGTTWKQLSVRPGQIADIAVDPQSPQVVYVAGEVGGVWVSRDAGTNWSPIYLDPTDRIKKIFCAGNVVVAQGYAGIYRLVSDDLGPVKRQWQEWEEKPESNPIAFVPEPHVDISTAGAVATTAATPGRTTNSSASGTATGTGIPCGDSTSCSGSGMSALAYSRGSEAALLWDKALQMGGPLQFPACRERPIRCERGTFYLSAKEVSFTNEKGEKVFAVPPSQVGSVGTGRHQQSPQQFTAFFRMRVEQKNYNFDYFPSGGGCRTDFFAQCPGSGPEQQESVANYIARTVPNLVSGQLGKSDQTPAASAPKPSDEQPLLVVPPSTPP